MKNFLKALCYIVSFFGFLGGAMLFLWLFVQTEFGILPHAEFAADSLMSAQQFCELTFGTLMLCCLASAFGVLAILNRRAA